MVNVIRYMKGYLQIKVWGYAPERFINLCGNHQIIIWDLLKNKEFYSLKLTLSDFYRIKKLAKKTKVRVVILERYGLPFFVTKNKKRKIFIAGFPICIIFLLFMTQFIWAIQFSGNSELTDDILLDFLEEENITFGTYSKLIDLPNLEMKLREEFPVITWTSTKIEGTKITIQIKENDLLSSDDKIEDSFESWDIVASKDGIVSSILTREGIPLVKNGDEVKEGDILISGSVPIYDNDGNIKSYQYIQADGDVFLASTVQYDEKMDLYYQYKDYTGQQIHKYFIAVGNKKFSWNIKNITFPYYDVVENLNQWKILDNIYLPIYTGEYLFRDYVKVDAIYAVDDGKEIMIEKFNEYLAKLEEKGVQILEKNVRIETSDLYIRIYGTLFAVEQEQFIREIDYATMESQIVIPQLDDLEQEDILDAEIDLEE